MKQTSQSKALPTLCLFWLLILGLLTLRIFGFCLLHAREIEPSHIKQSVAMPQGSSEQPAKNQKILAQTFHADFNHFFALSIPLKMTHCSQAAVQLRLKEKGASQWIVSNSTSLRLLPENSPTVFQFEPIEQSKGKSYEVELISIGGEASTLSLDQTKKTLQVQYTYGNLLEERDAAKTRDYLLSLFSWMNRDLHLSSMLLLAALATAGAGFIFLTLQDWKRIIEMIPKHTKDLIRKINIPDFIIVLFLFFFVSGICFVFSRQEFDTHHDGILFKPALDVARGAVLFRDTFTQYGALTTYIQGAAILLLGENMLVFKIPTVFFYGLNTVLIYCIYRRFLPKLILCTALCSWIFMAQIFYAPLAAWSSIFAIFFQLLTLVCLLKHSNNTWFVFGSGFFSGLTMMCRQPVGAFLFTTILIQEVYLYYINQKSLKQALSDIFFKSLGFLTVIASFISYFILTDSFIDWIKQSFVLSFFWAREFVIDKDPKIFLFRCLFPGATIWSFFSIATICSFLVFRKNRMLSIVSFVGLASWMQYFPMNTPDHFYYAATPIMPLWIILLYHFLKQIRYKGVRFSNLKIQLIACLAIILLQFPEMARGIVVGIRRSSEGVMTESPSVLKGMKQKEYMMHTFNQLKTIIDKYFSISPKGNIIIDHPDAFWSTLDPRIKNIYKVTVNWPVLIDNVYPEYKLIYQHKIHENTAMVFSQKDVSPGDGYCAYFPKKALEGITLFIYVPCNILGQMK